MERRSFLKLLAAAGLGSAFDPALAEADQTAGKSYNAARIMNEYSIFLSGEREALATPPAIAEAGPSSRST
jgi:uncharacterized protein (DUF1501 family)